MTGEQRCFVGYVQSSRAKAREAAKLALLTSAPHARDVERAETVRNIDAWYEIFGAKPGDELYLAQADRVRIR